MGWVVAGVCAALLLIWVGALCSLLARALQADDDID